MVLCWIGYFVQLYMPEIIRDICSQIVVDLDQIFCDPVDLFPHVLLVRPDLSLLVFEVGADDLLCDFLRLLLLKNCSDERMNLPRSILRSFSDTHLAAFLASLLVAAL